MDRRQAALVQQRQQNILKGARQVGTRQGMRRIEPADRAARYRIDRDGGLVARSRKTDLLAAPGIDGQIDAARFSATRCSIGSNRRSASSGPATRMRTRTGPRATIN
jgi:hypothetical protein